jgi:hypothetical protein
LAFLQALLADLKVKKMGSIALDVKPSRPILNVTVDDFIAMLKEQVDAGTD